ncbi:MAG: hypothetical protein NVSMB23_15420 [Myxococcales bacterium]
MSFSRSLAVLCCALSLAFAPLRAHAAGTAAAAVEASNQKLRASLRTFYRSRGPAREKARTQARAAVGALLDFDAFAKATLGKRWDGLPAADRARYARAMKGAMEANYLAKMQAGNVDVAQVKSEVLGEEPQGENTLVKTKIHSGADTASVDYLMAKGKGGPRAIDVITEGVSLVETYRDQINTLYPKKGLNGVIEAFDRVRKRAEKTQDAAADGAKADAPGAAASPVGAAPAPASPPAK